MSLSHLKYRSDIDGIRAIAVLLVVAFHAFPEVVHGGFIGVDIFFVISGFLISSIIFNNIDAGSFSFIEFYSRRIRRIFPALILVLFSCLVAGWFMLLPSEYLQLGQHVAWGAAFVANYRLWKDSGYFDNLAQTKPLLHLWSLGIEEQFYIAFPLLILGIWKISSKKLISKRLVIIILLLVASFLANVLRVENHSVEAFYLPFSRIWELLIGVILAYISIYKKECIPSKKYGDLLSVSGILLIIIGTCSITKGTIFPGYWALLPTFGAFFLIAAGENAWINRNILSNKLMVGIGLISFPLYLWHWPLLSFAYISYSGYPDIKLRLAILWISFLFAYVTYEYVEKNFRFRGRKPQRTIILCLAIISLLPFCWYVKKTNGFQNRFYDDKQIASITFNEKWGKDPICAKQFPKQEQCMQTFSDKPHDIVLIGDSHAAHFYDGINESIKGTAKNLLLIGAGGCLPFYGIETGKIGDIESCKDRIQDGLDYAIKTPSVKTIVLSSRGAMYITGHGFSDVEKEDRYLRLISDPENQDYGKIFELAMRDTFNRISKANKKIVFIVDVPELDFEPKNCVLPDGIYFRKERQNCSVEKNVFDARNKKYLEIVSRVAKDFPQALLFYTSNYLCNEQYCSAKKGNILMYRDHGHLSYDGSIFLGRKLFEKAKQKGFEF